MKILTISGSSRPGSANCQLLNKLPLFRSGDDFTFFDISTLPLFSDQEGDAILPDIIKKWRAVVVESEAVIISTPEYIHNIPAALKNALEWVYASGELAQKKMLPIVFTPKAPRGEKAMKSLLFSLTALEAQVVASLQIYQEDWRNEKTKAELEEMIKSAMELL